MDWSSPHVQRKQRSRGCKYGLDREACVKVTRQKTTGFRTRLLALEPGWEEVRRLTVARCAGIARACSSIA